MDLSLLPTFGLTDQKTFDALQECLDKLKFNDIDDIARYGT
jgi:hypothetical protein